MDEKFTKQVQDWLLTPENERDYDKGALFLLQLSNNQIMYRNISRNAKHHGAFIVEMIERYMKFRLSETTHQQVVIMQKKVEKIAQIRNLDATVTDEGKDETVSKETDNLSGSKETASIKETDSFKAGKRADHDELPPEIQALYVENAYILQKMRELHLRLRLLNTENATCPDSERFPFLKELIALDKQYHRNWQVYDSYQSGQPSEAPLRSDTRMDEKNIYRQINLAKGRYKKAPSDKLKEKIIALYNELASPTQKLTYDLIELKILPNEEK